MDDRPWGTVDKCWSDYLWLRWAKNTPFSYTWDNWQKRKNILFFGWQSQEL